MGSRGSGGVSSQGAHSSQGHSVAAAAAAAAVSSNNSKKESIKEEQDAEAVRAEGERLRLARLEQERLDLERAERESQLEKLRAEERLREQERQDLERAARQSQLDLERAQQAERQRKENEKLELEAMCSSKLQVMFDDFTRKSDGLFEHHQGRQRGLEETQKSTRASIEALKREKASLQAVMEDLNAAEGQISAYLKDREERGDVPVENMVGYSDTLSRQLFLSLAKDKAIEDGLLELDKAMGNESIDPEKYLQLVRKMSRQQFYVKELMHRIISQRRALGVY